MKRFVAFLIVLMIQEIQVDASPEEVCMEKIGLTFEESSYFLQKAKLPEVRDQTDQKFKCYASCFMEQINVLDGCSYQLESGKKHASEYGMIDLLPILDSCKDSSVGSEPCDCGYSVFKCLFDEVMANKAY